MAYIKLYQGSFIVVQMMRRHLENQDIKPIIKDESEVPNATKIINIALGQMKL